MINYESPIEEISDYEYNFYWKNSIVKAILIEIFLSLAIYLALLVYDVILKKYKLMPPSEKEQIDDS